MRCVAFSLRDFLGLGLVCCFVLAGYRLGLDQANDITRSEALFDQQHFFDSRLADWAASDENWTRLRERFISDRTPISTILSRHCAPEEISEPSPALPAEQSSPNSPEVASPSLAALPR